MIVYYRLKDEHVDQVEFVNRVVINTKSGETKIYYTGANAEHERRLKTSDIDYIDVQQN